MARNLNKPRKHHVSAYKNDVCVFHRGTDNLETALKWYAERVEASVQDRMALAAANITGCTNFCPDEFAPDTVVLWKGNARKKAFAEFSLENFMAEFHAATGF
jgi:hypothetical protein